MGVAVTGGNYGGAVRAIWWCSYDKEEFHEPRGVWYWAPVVEGEQSKHCHCGRKLARIG